MRKLCLIMLASVLLVPAAAFAERDLVNGGSLVISDASGKLTVSGHGLIFGHLDRGTITVIGDYRPDDNTALPSVSGAKIKFTNGNLVYFGSDVRFLFPGGRYTLVVDGSGVDLSAVGTGKLTAVGKGSAEDGWVTVDGGTPQSIDLIDVMWYGKSGALGSTRGKTG